VHKAESKSRKPCTTSS